jgi:hypothetical protein
VCASFVSFVLLRTVVFTERHITEGRLTLIPEEPEFAHLSPSLPPVAPPEQQAS